jgi:hypothetical protein
VIVQTITSQEYPREIYTSKQSPKQSPKLNDSIEVFMASTVVLAPDISVTSKKETKVKKGNTKQIQQRMKTLMKD